jgi:hypothetical protein
LVVIEVGDDVINQLPSVLLRRFGVSRSRRLVTPPHCPKGSCTTCSQSRCCTLIQSNQSMGFLHYNMLFM